MTKGVDNKRQHYVPVSYLVRWAHEIKKKKRRSRVWVFDGDGESRPERCEDICVSDFTYSRDTQKEKSAPRSFGPALSDSQVRWLNLTQVGHSKGEVITREPLTEEEREEFRSAAEQRVNAPDRVIGDRDADGRTLTEDLVMRGLPPAA